MEWNGSHVVITGGSSGIGEALAEQLAPRGANLTLIARTPDRLDEVAGRIDARHPDVDVVGAPCDVSDREAISAVIAAATLTRGPVDALICSAGITLPGRFLEADDETFREMIDVDYFGTLWPIRAVAPEMADRGSGSIVGVASAAALVGVYGYSAYGAAKFAVRGLLESLRTELAPHGVHVGCVYPPDVDTPMLTAEEPHKPAETKAIAGSIKPLTAARVAESIIGGIEGRDAEIYADVATRALARTVATAPGIYRRLFDQRVAKARR